MASDYRYFCCSHTHTHSHTSPFSQSYGRVRDQGKVLQTFVQSVVPGSPSFMAGLHPGDTVVAVNGTNVKYAPVEKVVEVIQEGAKMKQRCGV